MKKIFLSALFSLLVLVSFSSSSSLRKSLFRRQAEPQYCHAIEGFDCKCSHYRVTCTNDRELSSPISVVANEKGKYQSVELVITAPRDIDVTASTFEPVKELYKTDADNLEFRLKFEKFTALHLSSPSIFNRVFPDNLSPQTKKHLALEIYNPDVQPKDNTHLFQNLNADSLELYALYPFHGTFQQLFNGANIKFLRLSGGDIRTDFSQAFTGNIARLELAKQANALSVQNFPAYPAHELIINAFYITEFNHEHPPNYANLAELRVHSPERIPANAFRQFPNIQSLSVSTEKEIDPQAFSGLGKLEKLTIKDSKPTIELLNSVPAVKEFEASVEKLDEKTQCQFLEKLANGQVAVQAIPNGRECTCVSAYLDSTIGRSPCDARDCDQSSCAVIKNNYDASTRTFKSPVPVTRADGSNALRARDPRVYSAPFQVSQQDQDKVRQAVPLSQPTQQEEQDQRQPQQPNADGSDENNQRRPDTNYNPNEPSGADGDDQENNGESNPTIEGNNNRAEGEGNDNRPAGEGEQQQPAGAAGAAGNVDGEGEATNETGSPAKKGMSWLPIIIIAASIGALLVFGLIFLLIRKRRANKGYTPSATNEPAAPRA